VPSPLAQHIGCLLLVEIVHPQTGQLPCSHAGIQEEADDRQIAAVLERVALAGRQQRLQMAAR
jgi:hypothetical protein